MIKGLWALWLLVGCATAPPELAPSGVIPSVVGGYGAAPPVVTVIHCEGEGNQTCTSVECSEDPEHPLCRPYGPEENEP